jgi:hypothetical protein
MTACLALCATQVMAASSVQATTSGVLDSQSGLVWQEFASLSAGEALGYRLASDVEFEGLLGHATLGKSDSSTPTVAEMLYPMDPPHLYGAAGPTALLNISTQVAGKTPLFGPGGVTLGSWVRQDIALVANTRDTLGALLLAGISEATTVNSCQVFGTGNPIDVCGTSTSTSALLDRPRLIGQVSSSVPTTSPETGAYRTYLGLLGYSTANDFAYTNPQTLGYYMVQSVPEPGTWGLMSLGLVGLAAARRRRTHA